MREPRVKYNASFSAQVRQDTDTATEKVKERYRGKEYLRLIQFPKKEHMPATGLESTHSNIHKKVTAKTLIEPSFSLLRFLEI